MIGATTKGNDESKQNKTQNGDDLDRRQPELEFAKELDTDEVNQENDDEDDGNPNTRVDFLTRNPELNDKGTSGELVRSDDNVLEEVSPTNTETKTRIYKSRSISRKTIRHGNPGGHFTKGAHDHVDNETDKRIGNKDRSRTSSGQSRTGTNNQTGTKGTTNGNHGNVPCLEFTMKLVALLGFSEVRGLVVFYDNLVEGMFFGVLSVDRSLARVAFTHYRCGEIGEGLGR